MRIGIAGLFEDSGPVKNAGFDYLELPMKTFLRLEHGRQERFRQNLREAMLPVEAVNCFFPDDLRLYGGPDAFERVMEFSREGVRLAASFGAKIIVVGSGASRAVPEGMSEGEAERQFCAILGMLALLARPHEITVIPEALRKAETNLLNTVEEEISLVRSIREPNVGVMVDFFHFHENGEAVETLSALQKGELKHVHVAGPGRLAPAEEDRALLIAWRNALDAVSYRERVTLECRLPDKSEEGLRKARRGLEVFE